MSLECQTLLSRRGRVSETVGLLSSVCQQPRSELYHRDKQHAGHLIGLGGLYPCPDLVERILAPESGVTKEILDLGEYRDKPATVG
jgi:hypothetical protein